MNKRRFFLLTVAIALLGGLLVGTSQSAAATAMTTDAATVPAASFDNASVKSTICPQGWFCVWPKRNLQGDWKGGYKPNTCYSPFKPQGKSVSNQTGRTIVIYDDARCKGKPRYKLASGHYDASTPFKVRSVKVL
ncbi:peptidase inhibitor family I36 protein [Stackebrandtia nassauensis]|uniref:Peptidase inhibitor family I36 n=1 Tax=Stackebrandtia nassauensis (strain DSM 44728 / CIP 108903 / NRRL B-16338 / NBRC 102104 / LLR-40K-21) TaxID=446470 RepID=D3PWJ8_STANL|nr:peptidase inhibitor family I36 protein [Stackebrandtia nassauensis]ADD43220.1 hypothetical protein Snas_3558 [Stackebrandtia nassauensis DSM 44728]